MFFSRKCFKQLSKNFSNRGWYEHRTMWCVFLLISCLMACFCLILVWFLSNKFCNLHSPWGVIYFYLSHANSPWSSDAGSFSSPEAAFSHGCHENSSLKNKRNFLLILGERDRGESQASAKRESRTRQTKTSDLRSLEFLFLKKDLNSSQFLSPDVLWSRNVYRQQPEMSEIFIFSGLSLSRRSNSEKLQRYFDGICWRIFYRRNRLLKVKSVLYPPDAAAINRRR